MAGAGACLGQTEFCPRLGTSWRYSIMTNHRWKICTAPSYFTSAATLKPMLSLWRHFQTAGKPEKSALRRSCTPTTPTILRWCRTDTSHPNFAKAIHEEIIIRIVCSSCQEIGNRAVADASERIVPSKQVNYTHTLNAS